MSNKHKIVLIHCQNGLTSQENLVYDPNDSTVLHSGPANFIHPRRYFFGDDIAEGTDVGTPIKVIIKPTTIFIPPQRQSEPISFDSSSFVSMDELLETDMDTDEYSQDQIYEVGCHENTISGVYFDDEISHETFLDHVNTMIENM